MVLVLDTEGTGLDAWHGCKPFLVSATDGKDSWIWEGVVNPYNREDVKWKKEDLQEIQSRIDDSEHLLFHNAKYDIRMLWTIGIDAHHWEKVDDTLIASHVCCSGERHALKTLAYRYLGWRNTDEEELDQEVKAQRAIHKDYDIARKGHRCFPGAGGSKEKWHKMDFWLAPELCRKYALTDVWMTYYLWRMYSEVLLSENLEEQYQTRRKLLKITYNMEEAGLHFYLDGPDGVTNTVKRLRALQSTLQEKIRVNGKIKTAIDLNKPATIRFLLFDVLKFPIHEVSEKTGLPLINKRVLEYYKSHYEDDPIFRDFMEYREAGNNAQLLSSYVKWACDDSRLRPNILITGTRETRQSMNSPTTQTIKKELRGVFGPSKGFVWYDYDFVNIEMRIWVYLVEDPKLMEVFAEGGSVHLLVSSLIHKDLMEECESKGLNFKEVYEATWYQWVKNGNFCIIYAGQEKKADQTYKVPGAYKTIVSTFPAVVPYTKEVILEASKNMEEFGAPYITCMGGYRLDIDLERAVTTAGNYKVQGSAGYLIGEAMVNIDEDSEYKRTGAQMVNQVHDSLVIEVPLEHDCPELRETFKRRIEEVGLRYMPTCQAEYKLKYHPEDVVENGR